MTRRIVKPNWKIQLDASLYAMRSSVLETLRQKVCELQEQEICNLKEEYGARWDLMTRTASGSGYEICQEILITLNNLQAKDYYEFMTPSIVEEEFATTLPSIFPKISQNASSLDERAEKQKRKHTRCDIIDADGVQYTRVAGMQRPASKIVDADTEQVTACESRARPQSDIIVAREK